MCLNFHRPLYRRVDASFQMTMMIYWAHLIDKMKAINRIRMTWTTLSGAMVEAVASQAARPATWHRHAEVSNRLPVVVGRAPSMLLSRRSFSNFAPVKFRPSHLTRSISKVRCSRKIRQMVRLQPIVTQTGKIILTIRETGTQA